MTNTTTVNTFKKGVNGHPVPQLLGRYDGFKTWSVASKEDALYYAWNEVPVEMMIENEVENRNKALRYTSFRERMNNGTRYGMMKETSNAVEFSIWKEIEGSKMTTGWTTFTWIVR